MSPEHDGSSALNRPSGAVAPSGPGSSYLALWSTNTFKSSLRGWADVFVMSGSSPNADACTVPSSATAIRGTPSSAAASSAIATAGAPLASRPAGSLGDSVLPSSNVTTSGLWSLPK